MNARAHRGFTLIEMLVAISVLGVTLAAVVACFSTGLRVRARSLEHLAFERDARTFLERLRDDFASVPHGAAPPSIGSDAIVLWTLPDPHVVGAVRQPHLVTYQWSSSATLDSLLLRVEAPLASDPNDFDAVQEEFLAWTTSSGTSGASVVGIGREPGRSRFGDRAERNGRYGCWTGFPHLRGATFSLVEPMDDSGGRGAGSRVAVRLTGAGDRYLETDLWLGVVARDDLARKTKSTSEVLP